MKNLSISFVLLFIFCSCATHRIILKEMNKSKIVYFESVFNPDILVYCDKNELLSLYPKYINQALNDKDKTVDSLCFKRIEIDKKDTLRINQYEGITLDYCLYDLLLRGHVKVYDKNNNKFSPFIYFEKHKSKLGQIDCNFYHTKGSKLFYSHLLTFGE